MATQRQYTWHLGNVCLHGLDVEVWQRCTHDRQFTIKQDGRLSAVEILTADGEVGQLPPFWHVQVPSDVRRVLVLDEVSHNTAAATLRLPDLDIDINDAVLLMPVVATTA